MPSETLLLKHRYEDEGTQTPYPLGVGNLKGLRQSADPIESTWNQYEGTFHGGEGGRPTPRGSPNSGPRRSPELIENSFSDKSAMAKRLELVPGPGDFEKHSFRAILGAQKRQKKITLPLRSFPHASRGSPQVPGPVPTSLP